MRTVIIDPDSWKTPPFAHQVVGVKFLLKNAVGAIGDKPGSGKSKQFIDTACVLYNAGLIDTLLICAPSGVKSTWASPRFGQILQHCWVPYRIEEYSGRHHRIDKHDKNYLSVIVTNYEFIRVESRLKHFMPQLRNRKIMLVFDESSYIKSYRAAQTVASKQLRGICYRAYLANGSLISESLVDLYAPFEVLDKSIIGCDGYHAFRGRYCRMGGYQNKQIIGYERVEHLQQRLAPYILYRLKEDCFDLPPKMYNVTEVPMEERTWKIYKELRDEMIAWLDETTPVITMAAIVKIVRLSQITSGFVGGINRSMQMMQNTNTLFDGVESEEELQALIEQSDIRVLSSDKHDWVVRWIDDQIEGNPAFRVILWTRFRKEQELLYEKLKLKAEVLRIYGGQKKSEREAVIERFNQQTGLPMVLIGQPKAGGIGLNLQAQCNWAVYVSNDYSALTREQSEDRIHRSGQLADTVNYLDVLVTGPNGQKTIDHQIRKALLTKDAFAMKTAAYWRAAIAEE